MSIQRDSNHTKNKSRTLDGSDAIRQLNDQLRQTLVGGRVILTVGILSLGKRTISIILGKVRSFARFAPDNDPYGEHDFGAVEHRGRRVFFKIDYYDSTLQFASPDPADPSVTTRVLTVMLAEEY